MLAVVSFVKKGKLGGEYILDSHSTVPAKHTNLAYIILFVQWHPMGFFFTVPISNGDDAYRSAALQLY